MQTPDIWKFDNTSLMHILHWKPLTFLPQMSLTNDVTKEWSDIPLGEILSFGTSVSLKPWCAIVSQYSWRTNGPNRQEVHSFHLSPLGKCKTDNAVHLRRCFLQSFNPVWMRTSSLNYRCWRFEMPDDSLPLIWRTDQWLKMDLHIKYMLLIISPFLFSMRLLRSPRIPKEKF